jgi:hypothetical protein
MAKRGGSKPDLERLEELALMANLVPGAPHAAHAPLVEAAIPIPIIVGLNGHSQGTYTTHRKNPDTGTTYDLKTMGRFRGYGPATVTGKLQSTGFVANGRAFGTLEVVLPHGTLTLALTGPSQHGFSSLPTTFTYVITKGTGQFHNRVGDPVGRGTVKLNLIPPTTPTSLHDTGGATLVFHAGTVALA